MATPTLYTLSYDFTSFQAVNPSTPLPADRVEIEFENIELTTGQIITNLSFLQKDDNTLANGIVKAENLATELTIGLAAPVEWMNSQSYVVNDTVITNNKLYRCVEAHTSGVFATDLSAGKWVLVADYSAFLVTAESAKDEAILAKDAAEAAQVLTEAALDEFDDIYLGAKTADPALDNDGDALVEGAFYWNTVSKKVRIYNGTIFVDGIGATSLPIYKFTAVGGETSISGNDDNGSALGYTVGKLQVFINGSNETPNVTATDGLTITGISPALGASDVVEIYTFESVPVLEDIESYTIVAPAIGDYLLFSDISDANRDRRATLEQMLRADGFINGGVSAVPSVNDEFLFGDVSDGDKTKKSTIQGIVDLVSGTPVGALLAYAGSTAPNGWLLCGGQAVSRTSFAALYALIGTTYGAGDGTTTFNLPDLRGRVPAGVDNMGGSAANRLTNQSGGVDGTRGSAGGHETHELVTSQLASHDHDAGSLVTDSAGDHDHGVRVKAGSGGVDVVQIDGTSSSTVTYQAGLTETAGAHAHSLSGTTDTAGTGTPHNNIQPTLVLNYIIKT